MSFTAQHYQCCSTLDDPTLNMQNVILAAITALGATVTETANGVVTANESQQEIVLAEVSKLTKPSMG